MDNLKKLAERREELAAQMSAFVDKADKEERAMSEEEVEAFDAAEKEVRAIDETIARAAAARDAQAKKIEKKPETEDRATAEAHQFAEYIRGRVVEMRSGEQNVTMANNAAIIPTSIADRIINKVMEICPILKGSTIYHSKGNLKIPVWGDANSTHNIAVGYQTEFTAVTADAGKFTSVDLGGYLAGALCLIGRSVANSADMDVVGFVVDEMARRIGAFISKEMLVGTGSSAAQGATLTTNSMDAASATAITADELISLQLRVPQAYQMNACWTMNPKTLATLKKLKDQNGRYLLQDDITSEIPYRLLGKPVYVDDNMPEPEASAAAVLYGDYSGMAVNFREDVSVEVLREKYADQHALGVIGWFEFDAKVADNQKLAVLKMAAL